MRTLLFSCFTLIFTPSILAQSVTVTWTTTYQTMDGFGGQTWISANNMTDAQADMLFSPTNGIGLAYIRTSNTVDGSIPDLVTLQKAVARGTRVLLGLQSPPPSMKDSGVWTSGHLLTSQYGAYAAYVVNYIKNFQSHGIPVTVVSVQNEPDTRTNSLGGCTWTPSQMQTFVRDNLGPAIASNNITTQILLGESANWFDSDFVSPCLNDAACAPYVSIVAGHGYGNGNVDGTGVSYCCHTATAYSLGLSKGLHIWMSEVNGGFTQAPAWQDTNMWVWDPSIADAMVWAHSIHDYFTVANANAWFYWELASYSSANYNDGYVNHKFKPTKRYYAVGNWSKYVRPGWVRIDATVSPAPRIYITAFKETSSGSFAIVAINQNSSPVKIDFSLSGFPSVTSVTPTVTSKRVNLVDQVNAAVSGGAFSYSLPGKSVVTFHGTASSGSSETHCSHLVSQRAALTTGTAPKTGTNCWYRRSSVNALPIPSG
jgi:glucuronoarabinoxylan endo-1,4-beta-xylanase